MIPAGGMGHMKATVRLMASGVAILLLVAGFLLVVASANGDSKDMVPGAAGYIERQLPHLRVLPTNAAAKAVRSFLAKERPRQPSPFFCSGDFDGDGRPDAALLLREGSANALILTALHRLPDGGFKHYMLHRSLNQPTEPLEVYVTCEPPGRRRAVEGRDIRLRHGGILESFWGKGSVLYYFENGQYQRIGISD